MRRFKHLAIGLAALVALAMGGTLALLQTADPARLTALAAQHLSAALGEEVSFAGTPSLLDRMTPWDRASPLATRSSARFFPSDVVTKP